MRLNRIGYLFREGFRSIGTHAFMSFASVTIIMACLIIMGSVSLLSLNIDALIKDLEDQNEIVVFVDEKLSEDEAKNVCEAIRKIDNVSSVDFVTREDAMESFMNKYDSSFREGIDETVFRHRCVVHLTDIALMAQSKADLEATPGVAKVNAHLEYAKSFVTIRNIVSIISLVLIAILVFVSFFIMSNTIKLATFSRREEIAIMKMVGANNGFIRMPFIIEGLVLGILGGGLAFLAQWGIYELITGKLVTSLTGSLLNVIPFNNVAQYVFIAFMGVGVLVGTFGGVNAIRNYLKV
ncbi:MAG: permease-like cell division protein FtsX [Eubacteriales bacterium]|jgi:cell division transport system permease protein|nr:permease-like cell division protein FtsX [Eubacteriales bacterium]